MTSIVLIVSTSTFSLKNLPSPNEKQPVAVDRLPRTSIACARDADAAPRRRAIGSADFFSGYGAA